MFLIVGHTGFLGSHFLAKYPNSYALNSIGLFKNGEPCGFTVKELFGKSIISAVIYCAVKYRSCSLDEMNYVNSDYPYLLLNYCKYNCIPFVYFGSFFEKEPGAYMKDYINSKLRFLSLMNSLSYDKSFYLRLEHIYGPNDGTAKFIPSIIKKLKDGENIILNNPYHIRDFTPVEFVIEISTRFLSGELSDFYFEVGARHPQTSFNFIKYMRQTYIDYYGSESNVAQIIVDPKPSSVIHYSSARYHSIYDTFTYNYFQQQQQSMIEQMLVS